MFDLIYDFYQDSRINEAHSGVGRLETKLWSTKEHISRLERKVEFLILFNQAMAELLVKSGAFTKEDLIEMANEIDLRDGVKDGRITDGIHPCQKCNRRYNSRLNRCIYCGNVNQ